MKKINLLNVTIIVIAALALTSCNNSPEKKIGKLIKEEVQTMLYHPESYDPVATEIDSAFSPENDPKALDLILEAMDVFEETMEVAEEMQEIKESMAIYQNPYSAYDKEKYNGYKKKYDKGEAKLDKLQEKATEIQTEVTKLENQEPEFIGYTVAHRYRAKANNGNVVMADNYFIVNKEMTEIIASYDDEELEIINHCMEIMNSEEFGD